MGATLQVYYHLGELPQAAWSAVQFALAGATAASLEFWSPSSITALVEEATAMAKASSKTESASQRNLTKILRERRREASTAWATGVAQAALLVWNLHRVLSRKTDPVSRQVFLSVVAQASVPKELKTGTERKGDFSVFSIFWDKLCKDLGDRLQGLLTTAKLSSDVAALYPAVRSSILGMLGRLYDHMQTGMSSSSLSLEETASSTCGILGGSTALDSAIRSSPTLEEGEPTSALGSCEC